MNIFSKFYQNKERFKQIESEVFSRYSILRESFLTNVQSSLTSNMPRILTDKEAYEADGQALYNDWCLIGDDLRIAMKEYENVSGYVVQRKPFKKRKKSKRRN